MVINCHGKPGFLDVGGGGRGFGIEGVKFFYKFRGRNAIGRIWIVACSVAGKGNIGWDFCAALSKAADCTVIAGDSTQRVEKMFDFFRRNECIDEFEGTAHTFVENQMYSFINSGKEY